MTQIDKATSGKARIPLLGYLNRSVLLTYAGVVSAVLGIWLAQTARIEGALICLVISGLCDLFDGPVARRFARDAVARRFGQEIDSLADMVSFIALPVVVAFGLGVRSIWWVPVLAGYALAGLIRLGYFSAVTLADATDAPDGARTLYYRGVPVTYAALVLPVAALATIAVPATAGPWLVGATLALLGLLFVLDVPVRKPRGASYAVFAAVAVALVTALSFAEL
jgi:CDP-diacylglycerol--serine O-phosphatidyltransferase